MAIDESTGRSVPLPAVDRLTQRDICMSIRDIQNRALLTQERSAPRRSQRNADRAGRTRFAPLEGQMRPRSFVPFGSGRIDAAAVAKLLETSAAESRGEDFGEVPAKLDLWDSFPDRAPDALPMRSRCARIDRSRPASRKQGSSLTGCAPYLAPTLRRLPRRRAEGAPARLPGKCDATAPRVIAKVSQPERSRVNLGVERGRADMLRDVGA